MLFLEKTPVKPVKTHVISRKNILRSLKRQLLLHIFGQSDEFVSICKDKTQ